MSTSEKPKIFYFNIKGRDYPTKMILSCGNIPYEEVKFEFSEFGKYKGDMPMGQVPVMEYKTKKICQSRACAEFAADLAGLTPKDAWQRSKVTEMAGCFDDVHQKCFASYMEEPNTKKESRAKICKEVLPQYFAGMDKIIAGNNHSGFCVGDKLSAADIYVFCMVDMFKCGQFEHIPTTICDSYSNIIKVYDNVLKTPKAKECKGTADSCPVMKF